jgi:hypothetical protein
MRLSGIYLIALGLLVMVGSIARTPGEHDMYTGIGTIRCSPRFGLWTREGWLGITEYSKGSASGLRMFETYFQCGVHFVRFPVRAPVAGALVGASLACFGFMLISCSPRRET